MSFGPVKTGKNLTALDQQIELMEDLIISTSDEVTLLAKISRALSLAVATPYEKAVVHDESTDITEDLKALFYEKKPGLNFIFFGDSSVPVIKKHTNLKFKDKTKVATAICQSWRELKEPPEKWFLDEVVMFTDSVVNINTAHDFISGRCYCAIYFHKDLNPNQILVNFCTKDSKRLTVDRYRRWCHFDMDEVDSHVRAVLVLYKLDQQNLNIDLGTLKVDWTKSSKRKLTITADAMIQTTGENYPFYHVIIFFVKEKKNVYETFKSKKELPTMTVLCDFLCALHSWPSNSLVPVGVTMNDKPKPYTIYALHDKFL